MPEPIPDLCPACGGAAGDNWFDRSLCSCSDVMHTRHRCGYALDGCPYEQGERDVAALREALTASTAYLGDAAIFVRRRDPDRSASYDAQTVRNQAVLLAQPEQDAP